MILAIFSIIMDKVTAMEHGDLDSKMFIQSVAWICKVLAN